MSTIPSSALCKSPRELETRSLPSRLETNETLLLCTRKFFLSRPRSREGVVRACLSLRRLSPRRVRTAPARTKIRDTSTLATFAARGYSPTALTLFSSSPPRTLFRLPFRLRLNLPLFPLPGTPLSARLPTPLSSASETLETFPPGTSFSPLSSSSSSYPRETSTTSSP